jgi:hypothetical protein
MPANTLPQDNPLAIKVRLDTIMNGAALNPNESFTVTGPTFIGGVPTVASNEGLNIIRDSFIDSTAKLIPLERNGSLYLTIYYPTISPGRENYLYLVPTQVNESYEGSFQDLIDPSQLDVLFHSSAQLTWRQAAKSWVAKMSTTDGNALSGVEFTKMLGFTFVGNETNLTSSSASFEVALKFIS